MRRFIFLSLLLVLTASESLPPFLGLKRQHSLQRSELFLHGLKHLRVKNDAMLGGVARLLLSSGGNCAWSSTSKTCAVSNSAILHFLKTSKTDLAKYIIGEFECFDKTLKATCNKAGKCTWDDEDNNCSVGDLSYGYEDSPCVKAAPILFNVVKYDSECSKIDDKKTCTKTKYCEWSGDSASCSLDFFLVAFHLKSYQEKISEVASTLMQDKSAALSQDPKFTSSPFTWQAVLDWKPPKSKCPKKAQELMCQLAEAYLAVYLPVYVYCEGKYTSADSCRKDTHCEVTRYGSCVPADYVDTEAAAALFKVLLDSVPEGPDRQYVTELFTCPDYESEDECTKGDCAWNGATKRCSIKVDALFESIAQIGGPASDGLCVYLHTVGSSGCEEGSDESQCGKLEKCSWDKGSGCGITDEAFVSAALEGHHKALKRYTELVKQCTAHTSKTECSATAEAISFVV